MMEATPERDKPISLAISSWLINGSIAINDSTSSSLRVILTSLDLTETEFQQKFAINNFLNSL